jgi:hypothetical protein
MTLFPRDNFFEVVRLYKAADGLLAIREHMVAHPSSWGMLLSGPPDHENGTVETTECAFIPPHILRVAVKATLDEIKIRLAELQAEPPVSPRVAAMEQMRKQQAQQ